MAKLAGITDAASSEYWNYANSLSTFIIVLLSPTLGTIADYKNFKKRFFIFFSSLGIIFTLLLGFIPSDKWLMLLIFYIITSVGFSGANIFYDAFLVDVSDDSNMDRVSANGYAYGYISSVIPFIICIGLINFSGLDKILMTKLSFIITALWWGLLTIPMLRSVKQVHYIEPEPNPISNSFKRLLTTLKSIKEYKVVSLFLLAYFFYIDGVGTIIKNAAVFGNQIGLDTTGLMIALLLTQVVAFPFAILYGKLSKKFGAKNLIIFGILTYTIVCCMSFFLDTLIEFIILGFLVASAQGGIQALSRSYFAKIIPKERNLENLLQLWVLY